MEKFDQFIMIVLEILCIIALVCGTAVCCFLMWKLLSGGTLQ